VIFFGLRVGLGAKGEIKMKMKNENAKKEVALSWR